MQMQIEPESAISVGKVHFVFLRKHKEKHLLKTSLIHGCLLPSLIHFVIIHSTDLSHSFIHSFIHSLHFVDSMRRPIQSEHCVTGPIMIVSLNPHFNEN